MFSLGSCPNLLQNDYYNHQMLINFQNFFHFHMQLVINFDY